MTIEEEFKKKCFTCEVDCIIITEYQCKIKFLLDKLFHSRELLKECLEGLNFLHIEYKRDICNLI